VGWPEWVLSGLMVLNVVVTAYKAKEASDVIASLVAQGILLWLLIAGGFYS
jgi:hypothetical protein